MRCGRSLIFFTPSLYQQGGGHKKLSLLLYRVAKIALNILVAIFHFVSFFTQHKKRIQRRCIILKDFLGGKLIFTNFSNWQDKKTV